MMSYLRVFWMFLLIVGTLSCAEENRKTSADDLERPVDWSAQWVIRLKPDTSIADRDVLQVTSFESDQSLNALSDELFAMAFSGEVQVLAPDIFGGMDKDNALDPKALLEALKVFDTVMVEDIYTGKVRDTVIDNSFSADKASALVITFNLSGQGSELDISASHLAMGTQVFDPITAKRRGDAKRFYLHFQDAGGSIDHLKLYTDSLGNFRPAYFEVYPEETKMSLKDWVVKQYGAEVSVELSMKVELSFLDGLLRVRDVQLVPVPRAI